MESLWKATEKQASFPHLQGDTKTDVLIIGGGMAGVLTAYFLQQAGVDYLLAEAQTLGDGTTKNTTAKITAQHGLIYQKIAKEFDLEKAWLYFKANTEALEQYRQLCKNISCGFETQDSFVYAKDSQKKLENEMNVLNLIGVNAKLTENLPLPLEVLGAVEFSSQAQFHPLHFLQAIAEGLHICEHTCVEELRGMTAVTPFGNITAKKIIVTTHFPFLNKHGSYFLKLYQRRSYVLALENAPQFDGMYVDEAEKGMSFRHYDQYLFVGGGDHRTGKFGGNWEELRVFVKEKYPNAIEKYAWAAQDCMTLDGIPYIGQYAKSTPDLYVATGFGQWGMTTSMVAAKLLCDLVMGKDNPYAALFSPSRRILRKQLAINAGEAVMGLITPAKKRCPHLGCALHWNAAEHSWDCACHGSRFSEGGKVIDNPATGDLGRS